MNCKGFTKAGKPCTRKGGKNGFCWQHVNEKKRKIKPTITITFGDVAENHAGMEKIGKEIKNGLNYEDLKEIQEKLNEMGIKAYMKKLHYKQNKAYLLVIRNGVDKLLNTEAKDDLLDDLLALKWDTKFKDRGKVKNKLARHNLCFDKKDRKPNYEEGKGTIVAFKRVKILHQLKLELEDLVDKLDNSVVEGNLYYDHEKCGIGYHGDSERKITIGVRLGETMPLCYQWFKDFKPVGDRIDFSLDHGDLYFMCEKATGNDWKKRSVKYSLRHAAGDKYIAYKKRSY